MKKLPTFLAGMLTMALIGGLGMSALAATGQLTLTVDPVNIQVNGTTFAPKDAKGNDVPVFALNGTTYAPLRALAEAYGLTVGYDEEQKMATVTSAGLPAPTTSPATYSDWSKEDEAAYQEFKGLWVVSDRDFKGGTAYLQATCTNQESGLEFYNNNALKQRNKFALRLFNESFSNQVDKQYTMVIFELCVNEGSTWTIFPR